MQKASFTLTGKDAIIIRRENFPIAALKASFVLTGKNTTFTHIKKYPIVASKGSYILTGKDIIGGFGIVLTKGTYALDGKVAAITYTPRIYRALIHNTKYVVFNNKILVSNGN